MSLVSFREYERIPVVEALSLATERAFSVAEINQLDGLAARLHIPVIEHLSRTRVRPAQYVGAVHLANRTVEFLPKIEHREGVSDLPAVRHNLLRMLLVAYDLDGATPGKAALEKANDGWLDLLMRLFCRALADQLRRGLIRRYREECDDLQMVRGQMQIEEQLRRNLVHRERTACAFDEFDEDHALNQLLRVAIVRMLRLASNNTTQQALRELLPAFEGVSDIVPTSGWLARVTLDRISERFDLCLGMARLFLQGTTTGLYAGEQSSFALLFDMNDLFERFVARTLRRELRKSACEVSIQDCRHHLVRDRESSQRLFRLRPDIVVLKGGLPLCVVDTKWKRLSPDERKLGIAQGDLYQMLAYAESYDCGAILLIYPWDPAGGEHLSLRRRLVFHGGKRATVSIGELSLQDLSGVGSRLADLLEGAGINLAEEVGA
ncbi:MAG: McrC family protein [Accumulibacter sp.]|jgi:5-methylcytosine-specific restriction enzyme subunit McrC|uniref:McrC family protein n=1 Tax=Accumulibacter sp. TaxID=2053492 RepID=UPI001AC6B74B|nr:McrC family protein [Accumulibacter sp.]MBN8437969.1 McrC family protein [Accumulibacter sp.]